MSDLVSVARPNGKVYRPRKPPRAVRIENDDPDVYGEDAIAWVFVIGTHDVDLAWTFARSRYGADYVDHEKNWVRLVMRRGERVYEFDEVRGAPVVIFNLREE